MEKFSENLKISYDSFYSKGMWNMGGGSRSGLGSSIEYTVSYSQNLIDIIHNCDIDKIFDCSCGDWFWMQYIKDNFKYYVGNDICKKLIDENTKKFGSDNIKFISDDMLSQMKKINNFEYDLLICRHTLEHLPTDYVIECLNEIKRVSKYAIITSANEHHKNEDIIINFDNYAGKSRSVNLDLEPYFNILQSPILKFWDSVEYNKSDIGCFGYLYKFD